MEVNRPTRWWTYLWPNGRTKTSSSSSCRRIQIVWLMLVLALHIRQCNGDQPICPSVCTCPSSSVALCKDKQLSSLPEKFDPEVVQIYLSNNSFTSVPSNLSAYKNLTYLAMEYNRIRKLDARSLHGLENLNQLRLANNRLTYVDIDKTVLKPATSLTFLDLSNNPLDGFPRVESTSVTRLDLTNCSLSTLQLTAFDGLPNLNALHMARNRMSMINTQIDGPNVVWLNWTSSRIQFVDEHALDKMPKLKFLYMPHNVHLKDFPASSPFLEFLDLKDCNLMSVPHGNFPKLLLLDLTGNHIRRLRPFSFAKMPSLKYIHLGHNSLSTLEPETFTGAKGVTNIDLSYNTIRTLDPWAFSDLTSLDFLLLNNNYFQKIPPLVSKSLNKLHIYSCEITSIEWNCLTNMTNLEIIDVGDNMFTKIPANWLSYSLTNLSMANCRISMLRNDSFRAMPKLDFVDIKGNRLVELQFQPFRRLHYVRVVDNPWRCDCHNPIIKSSYMAFFTIDSDIDAALCHSPQEFEGKTFSHACAPTWVSIDTNPSRLSPLGIAVFLIVCVLLIVAIFGVNYLRKHGSDQLAILSRRVSQDPGVPNEEFRLEERRELIEENPASDPPQPSTSRDPLGSTSSLARRLEDPSASHAPPSYQEALNMPQVDSSSHSSRKPRSAHSTPGSRPKLRRKRRSDSATGHSRTSYNSQDSDAALPARPGSVGRTIADVPSTNSGSRDRLQRRRRRKSRSRSREASGESADDESCCETVM